MVTPAHSTQPAAEKFARPAAGQSEKSTRMWPVSPHSSISALPPRLSNRTSLALKQVIRGIEEEAEETIVVKLLVWTTTPWTLPTNMGITVHSELDYLLLRHGTDDLLIVGCDRLPFLHHVIGDTTVLYSFKGSDLINSRYKPLFRANGILPESLPLIHAHHVTASSGSGLVHCAPAHGAEDYQAFLAQDFLSKGEGKTDVDVQEILCLVGSDGTFSEELIKNAKWLDETVGNG